MCGFAGLVFGDTRPVGKALVEGLLRTLEHRGPDDRGILTWRNSGGVRVSREPHNINDARALLVHQRLSILDLSPSGWQPMATADGRFWIAYNGEIYNYIELRRELESHGVSFQSRTDTEVLLNAWSIWGPESLNRLTGMFAFAILDTHQEVLHLVRDFFGIKPLYYARLPDGVAFASEIPPLLGIPGVSRAVNARKLARYLRFGLTDEGAETMYADIYQVPQGHYLRVDLKRGGDFKIARYWKLVAGDSHDLSFAGASNRIREIFLENVRLHLRSDVPVGAALSGGLDSSSIVSAIRHLEPGLELHTFSFIADDDHVSEERYVDIVARKNRTISHKVRIAPQELVSDLDYLVRIQGEPFGSTSIYAQHHIFREAKEQGIKVMLDGQGADELLAGYTPYGAARIISLLAEGRIKDAVELIAKQLKLPGRKNLLMHLINRLLPPRANALVRKSAGYDLAPAWLNQGWFSERQVTFTPVTSISGLTKERLKKELIESVEVTHLPHLLRYEDRNSMAHSIESRVPFLTPKLATFILSLPEEYILSANGESKAVLRSAMRGLVPAPILDRRDKIGLATPEQKWMSYLAPWVEEQLHSETFRSIPVFRHDDVLRDWKQIVAGKRKFDFRVWRWINLTAWSRIFEVKYE